MVLSESREVEGRGLSTNMMSSIVLLTKDVLMTDYLPTYGNRYWSTPNISELAKKGTIFERHYAAAPSTAMSFTSMFVGKYPYELDRKKYEHVKDYDQTPTLFDEMAERGYQCHIIWSHNYMTKALPFSRCFGGSKTIFHCLDLNQPVGPHIESLDPIVRDDAKAERTLQSVYNEINSLPQERPVFLWIHLPHVLIGRTCYGDDIDLVDRLIGFLRERFGDGSIYISADHGHMNGRKGKWAYGFDVYEPAIRIPLISPRIMGAPHIGFPTSNVQLKELILTRQISRNEYVLSDSAYYGQLHRRLAVITARFKYIFNKLDNSEELYDLDYDPGEEVNLAHLKSWDDDRKRYTNVREVYFYPSWDQAELALESLRAVKSSVWREGTPTEELCAYVTYRVKRLLLAPYSRYRLRMKKHRK